jgi:hypothetical protein
MMTTLNRRQPPLEDDLKIFKVEYLSNLEERLILEDGPSGLIKSDMTNHPPTNPHADGLFRSNHWSDLIQISNLDRGDQSKVFKYLKLRLTPMEDNL